MSSPALEHAAQAATMPAPRRATPTALPVGRTNDPLEHEADRVAREVLHSRVSGPTGRCACGGTPGAGGECSSCRTTRLGLRRTSSSAAPSSQAVAPPVVHEVLAAPGRALDGPTRAFFEPRLGLDLSEVRVHDDSRAARSADAVGALAYTVGSDVVFGASRHSPHTTEGRRLLAHELAHVAQRWSAPLAVRRQEPGETPPASPAGTVAFEGCDETRDGRLPIGHRRSAHLDERRRAEGRGVHPRRLSGAGRRKHERDSDRPHRQLPLDRPGVPLAGRGVPRVDSSHAQRPDRRPVRVRASAAGPSSSTRPAQTA